MTLSATIAGLKREMGEASAPAPLEADALIRQLDQIDVVGRQMHERDCLIYTFGHRRVARSSALGEPQAMITAQDVLAAVADASGAFDVEQQPTVQ
ncbi:hypothetical protein [Sphingosinicella sp. BN140058]|uniref:hypothetical protein n=1 Tax=Sphingosinicella sp. BN140058 TaxID=1892855 RepID=UPI0010136760|nr:hypothetical protein [Sphingosinicella sp. BN140058]QAY80480.1 hypothetical protein ETR14_27975 [Sphingosinicella sp. BN140058]